MSIQRTGWRASIVAFALMMSAPAAVVGVSVPARADNIVLRPGLEIQIIRPGHGYYFSYRSGYPRYHHRHYYRGYGYRGYGGKYVIIEPYGTYYPRHRQYYRYRVAPRIIPRLGYHRHYRWQHRRYPHHFRHRHR